MTDLSMFDLIINTLPGSANLYVDRSFLQSVKRGCVYASIGRGNTTDETALLEALETKHIEAAILDVTAQEPLPENHPFWALPNVVLTQHSGGGSRYEEESKMNLFLQNIKAFLSGSALTHAVTDFSRGY
jgi:glyoxylate/hydroxypyruvate reductase